MVITKKAQDQLDSVLDTGECLEIGLRGGGCNGLIVTLDKAQSSVASELDIGGNVKFADETARKYLYGGELDYQDEGFAKAFLVNPAEGTAKCGCGNSISLPPA
jgi:iron-sulfur cluster assembly protein